MTKKHYNPDWNLHMSIQWKQNPNLEKIDCPTCGGRGTLGGHIYSLDDPEKCPDCLGHRKVLKTPLSPCPEIPQEFVDHMHAAWDEYFKDG